MDYKEKRKLLNAFVIFYLFAFLFFNWEDVSWIFNYNFLSRAFSDVFQQESHQVLSTSPKKEEQFEYSPRENSLEIPKIGISAPLVIGSSIDAIELKEDLDRGVVYYPDSVLPGESGQTVVLGHSAPQGWPKINYDWVFSELNSLESGDSVSIYYSNRKYTYYVKEKVFLERGEELPENNLTNNLNTLILISCWPPGKDLRRIAVRAELNN